MPEDTEKKKSLFEGGKKFLYGVGLTVVGIVISLKGNLELGKYLIGAGIAIVTLGNVYDHQVEITKMKMNNKNEEVKK